MRDRPWSIYYVKHITSILIELQLFEDYSYVHDRFFHCNKRYLKTTNTGSTKLQILDQHQFKLNDIEWFAEVIGSTLS